MKSTAEAMMSEKAEEIAQERYGREFGELPPSLMMKVWLEAEDIVRDYVAEQFDHLVDQIREEGC